MCGLVRSNPNIENQLDYFSMHQLSKASFNGSQIPTLELAVD